MSKEDQRVNPYPVRLSKETKQALEVIAKANGRSLNAEIAMRLDESLLPRPKTEWKHMLDPAVYALLEEAAREEGRSLHAEILLRLESSLLSSQRLDWKQILDPAVYLKVKQDAELWNHTIEEAIRSKLLEAYDSELADTFLQDLSGEMIVRRMKKIEEMRENGEAEEVSFNEAFKSGITMGQILDERMEKALKKRQGNQSVAGQHYPFYGGEGYSFYGKENELFVRSIIREELAKAGIKPSNESE